MNNKPATPTVYGISNCDTVKKARKWLQEQSIDYHWHDLKKQGVSPELLQQWLQAFGRETLLNRKGTTWRKLSADEQAHALTNDDNATACMLRQNSVIKRPVVDWGNGVLTLGFDAQQWLQIVTDRSKQSTP